MGINSYIARQFGKPAGFGGRIITAIMNRQNNPLYEETAQHLSLCSLGGVIIHSKNLSIMLFGVAVGATFFQ